MAGIHGHPGLQIHDLGELAAGGDAVLHHGVGAEGAVRGVQHGVEPHLVVVLIILEAHALHAPADQGGAFLGIHVVDDLKNLVHLAGLAGGAGDDVALLGGDPVQGVHGRGVVLGFLALGGVFIAEAGQGQQHHAVGVGIGGHGVVQQGVIAGIAVGVGVIEALLVAGHIGIDFGLGVGGELGVNQALGVPLAHGHHKVAEVLSVIDLGPVGHLASHGIQLGCVVHQAPGGGKLAHQIQGGAVGHGQLVGGVAVAVGVLLLEGHQHIVQLRHVGGHLKAQAIQPVLADGIAGIGVALGAFLHVAEGGHGAVGEGHGTVDVLVARNQVVIVRHLFLQIGEGESFYQAVLDGRLDAAGVVRPVPGDQVGPVAAGDVQVDHVVVVVGGINRDELELHIQAGLQLLHPQRVIPVIQPGHIPGLMQPGNGGGLLSHGDGGDERAQHGHAHQQGNDTGFHGSSSFILICPAAVIRR